MVTAAVLLAATAEPALAADPTIQGVIDRLRLLLVGLLVGLASLALTVGGVRYLAAGGDPGGVQKAKMMFKAAAVGYAIAALAPSLVASARRSTTGSRIWSLGRSAQRWTCLAGRCWRSRRR